jgi:hypothetical protein
MPSCPDEIFRHDLASWHLSGFGRFLDIVYQLLLLLFQFGPFTIKLTLSLLKRSLMLT